MFNAELDNYIQSNNIKNNIIIGDIDILLSGNEIEEYKNILASNGFQSYIKHITRRTINTNSCMDHIYAKIRVKLLSINTSKIESNITDHYPIVLKIINMTNKPIQLNKLGEI